MDEEVMRKHIELYVNDFSIDLKATGRQAVQQLHNIYQQQHGMAESRDLFIQG